MTNDELRVGLSRLLMRYLTEHQFSDEAKVELGIRLVHIIAGILASSVRDENHLQEAVTLISGKLRDSAAGAFADLSRLLAVARESRSERSVH